MIPKNIRKQHILKAIESIDAFGIPRGRDAVKFRLELNQKSYPPKYVLGLANKFANGHELAPAIFNGGQETNDILTSLGIDISRDHASTRSNRGPLDTRRQERHDQRCSECKNTLFELFRRVFGTIKVDHKIQVPARLDDLAHTPCFPQLKSIFTSLTTLRANADFVGAKTLPRCDLFVPSPAFVVEFDEPQHFTKERGVSLSQYPTELRLGFDLSRLIQLCERVDARDHDLYRDEARAWYDTIRDFLPMIDSKFEPTVRIPMGDFQWCRLNPEMNDDLDQFKNMLKVPSQTSKRRLPAANRPLRIGRTIFDIGRSRSSLKASGKNMWHEHRRLISATFVSSPNSYYQRISQIFHAAKANLIDILVLPACSLTYRNDEELAYYRAAAQNIPWLVTGLMKIPPNMNPRQCIESAEVWHYGKSVCIIPFRDTHVEVLQMDSISAFVAISSSIGKICSGEGVMSSKTIPPVQGSNAFAFDLGHHQYNGRYVRTLRRVLKAIQGQSPEQSTVILSFWKFLDGNIRTPWAVSDDGNDGMSHQRISLEAPDHSLTDFLDLFESPSPKK